MQGHSAAAGELALDAAAPLLMPSLKWCPAQAALLPLLLLPLLLQLPQLLLHRLLLRRVAKGTSQLQAAALFGQEKLTLTNKHQAHRAGHTWKRHFLCEWSSKTKLDPYLLLNWDQSPIDPHHGRVLASCCC